MEKACEELAVSSADTEDASCLYLPAVDSPVCRSLLATPIQGERRELRAHGGLWGGGVGREQQARAVTLEWRRWWLEGRRNRQRCSEGGCGRCREARAGLGCPFTLLSPTLPPPSRHPPVGAEATGPRDNGLPPPPPAQPPPVGSRRRRAGAFGLGAGSALSLPGPALQGENS